MLSIDQTSGLLRLYLSWQKRIENNPDHEANEFYLWISEEKEDEDDLEATTGGLDGVKEFINQNEAILSGARYLKDLRETSDKDVREDVRISINTHLYFTVYDCTKNPELEGEILRGILLDMAPTGIRIETDVELPQGTIITMTVIQIGDGVTRYHLTGEVRWARPSGTVTHLGITIYEIEDNERWQEFYFVMSSNF